MVSNLKASLNCYTAIFVKLEQKIKVRLILFSPLYIYRSTLDLDLVKLLTYIADLKKYVCLVSLSYKIILCFICHSLTDSVQVSHITPLP